MKSGSVEQEESLKGNSSGVGCVMLDTTVLTNFLQWNRTSLLAAVPNIRFLTTDHTITEIADQSPEHKKRLLSAIDKKVLDVIRVDFAPELERFAELYSLGSLSAGECATLSCCIERKLHLATDDGTLAQVATTFWTDILILSTESVVGMLVKSGILSVEDASAMLEHDEGLTIETAVARFPRTI